MDDKRIELIIVVNGQPVPEKASLDEQVGEIVARALKESGNSGQPIGSWELRDDSGQIVDMGRKIGDLGFKEGEKLFLNLKAGVGGTNV